MVAHQDPDIKAKDQILALFVFIYNYYHGLPISQIPKLRKFPIFLDAPLDPSWRAILWPTRLGLGFLTLPGRPRNPRKNNCTPAGI